EDARVRTDFPDAASIEIRERTPVATMAGADGLSRVLDADGRVLGVVEGVPVALVWISGPGTLDAAPGDFASVGYSSAASLVTKLTPNVRSRVESMQVTPDGSDLVLLLSSPSGPIEVRFGSAIGENAQIEKLVRLERVLEDVGEQSVTVIDVSTSEVTVR
ncbi:MAG: cell division protein FtsQ/DivIB, partial [Ilumatobacteraceae bacterium]